MGLGKNKNNGTFLTIRSGHIVKRTKDETGKWLTKPEDRFDFLTGYIRDLNSVTKTFENQTYQELQITVDAPINGEKYERFTLTYPLYKAFSDGFLLGLANADLEKLIKISAYIKGKKDNRYATTFCALRYADDTSGDPIQWVKGFPDVEIITLPDNTEHKNKKKRMEFIDKIYADLKNKLILLNKDKVIELVDTSVNFVETDDDVIQDEL